MKRPMGRVLLGALLLQLTACAAIFKSDPLVPAYYSPLEALEREPAADQHPELALRLRRVRGAAHLRENRVYRLSEFEYRLYETRLWTEEPADYVRRALELTLFERLGLRRSHSTRDATLEVEVTAFDEHRSPSGARVEVVIQLYRENEVLLQETLRVERPVSSQAGDEGHHDEVTRALGHALAEVTDTVAAKVVAALAP